MIRPRNTWIQIRMEVPVAAAEWSATCLTELTGNGVEIQSMEDAAKETLLGYVNAATGETALTIIDNYKTQYGEVFPSFPLPFIEEKEFQEEDWASSWKENFKPLHINERIVIKPNWEEYQRADGETVINIDPGLAFGTGHHDSTKFALQLLEDVFREPDKPKRILDVGCGSGILAISAAAFGGETIIAIDNDPDALNATAENIQWNPVAKHLLVSSQHINTIHEDCDLIIANIVFEVLASMVEDFSRLLIPGGALILAGLLKGWQEEAIKRLYLEHNFSLHRLLCSEEWVAFYFRKNI